MRIAVWGGMGIAVRRVYNTSSFFIRRDGVGISYIQTKTCHVITSSVYYQSANSDIVNNNANRCIALPSVRSRLQPEWAEPKNRNRFKFITIIITI